MKDRARYRSPLVRVLTVIALAVALVCLAGRLLWWTAVPRYLMSSRQTRISRPALQCRTRVRSWGRRQSGS